MIEALFRWLEIREENGIPFPRDLISLKTDIDHSVLLKRLMNGKEIFPEPPPKAYGYPCYKMLEEQIYKPGEVWFHNEDLVINQTVWKIIERISDTEYIVSYEYVVSRKFDKKMSKNRWTLKKLDSSWSLERK